MAAFIISAAAAEVLTAPEPADPLPTRPAAPAADLLPPEASAVSATTTLRAGAAVRWTEPRAPPLLVPVARFSAASAAAFAATFSLIVFAIVAFAIAISPLHQRPCFEKTN
ncbi:MAG: hypothetical protein ACTHNZ_01890 [Trinickia sp.]|uniref:hypothetical protein n=1 Tax=Trinickia sp. TaxID=2571163 RepID=UPI003F7F16B4